MDIQTQQSSQLAAPTTANSQSQGSSSALASDFETFLKMLTTQMENQDPLNPVESSDFAVQLATFSGVEQQIRTNALLEDVAGGFGISGLAQISGWVGMEARLNAPAQFNGTPITLAPEPEPGSEAAYLVVKDSGGNTVSREQLPLGASTVDWAGVGDSGSPLPNGTYVFSVESIKQGEVTATTSVDHYALVVEARQTDVGLSVVLASGEAVNSNDVRALRSATDGSGASV